jgi:hypothetical protein
MPGEKGMQLSCNCNCMQCAPVQQCGVQRAVVVVAMCVCVLGTLVSNLSLPFVASRKRNEAMPVCFAFRRA